MTEQSAKLIRFAIYASTCSEIQGDPSIQTQINRCKEAIEQRGGIVTGIYSDNMESGSISKKKGLMEIRAHAEQGRFDAVMLCTLDRLARDHYTGVLIKALLQREYGLKLYCVYGSTKDDDDSVYATMMDQLLVVISKFYSKNLSNDIKRGKPYYVQHGFYNKRVLPLGYELVEKADVTKNHPERLCVNPEVAPILVNIFKLYASGRYRFGDLVNWINIRSIIQKFRGSK